MVDVDNTVIEDMTIVANPTSADDESNDFAIKVEANNVIIRNVVVHHAANGMGIYGMKSANLTIENVQVIAYGNAKGA